LVSFESQSFVGDNGIESLILQAISAQLVNEADAAALLREIKQDPVTFLRDRLDRSAQLIAAVAFKRAEQIAGETFGVQPREHRHVCRRSSNNHRVMFRSAICGTKG